MHIYKSEIQNNFWEGHIPSLEPTLNWRGHPPTPAATILAVPTRHVVTHGETLGHLSPKFSLPPKI